jgi:hypothetical protein
MHPSVGIGPVGPQCTTRSDLNWLLTERMQLNNDTWISNMDIGERVDHIIEFLTN